MIDSPPVAIPAATVIVLREGSAGLPELLMVERSAAMAFAPGALVFPGGRVDPGDRTLATRRGVGDLDDAPARVAAIRETIEEIGLAIGLSPPPDRARLAALRRALASGGEIAPTLAAGAMALDLDALTPFARWRPNHPVTRIFDARFYLARLPAGASTGSIDATENARLLWATAAGVLASLAAGTARAVYPTRRVLERLATFASIDAAFADAAAYPATTVTPWIETRGGIAMLCIPEGLGYPVTAEPLGATPRG